MTKKRKKREESPSRIVQQPVIIIDPNANIGFGKTSLPKEVDISACTAFLHVTPNDVLMIQKYIKAVCKFISCLSNKRKTDLVDVVDKWIEPKHDLKFDLLCIKKEQDEFLIIHSILSTHFIHLGEFPYWKRSITIDRNLKNKIDNLCIDESLKIGSYLVAINARKKDLMQIANSACVPSKLVESIGTVRNILARLKKRQERQASAYRTIREIDFFTGEYAKRRLVAESCADPQIKELCQRVFGCLKEVFGEFMGSKGKICKGCIWATSPNDAWGAFGLPYIAKDHQCNVKSCLFRTGIELCTNILYCKKFPEYSHFPFKDTMLRANPFLEDDKEKFYDRFEECLELTLRYRIYSYDLFVINSPERIITSNADFPNVDFFYSSSFEEQKKHSKGGKGHSSAVQALEWIADSRKNELLQDRYIETNESRLIGLWLWDKFNADPSNNTDTLTKIILSLRDEEWFRKTAAWRMTFENDTKEQSTTFLREPIELFRRIHAQASKSIKEGTILKMS